MSKEKDLTGIRSGRLVALAPTGRFDRWRSRYWLCACDCGTQKEIHARAIRQGLTKSCGCLLAEHCRRNLELAAKARGTAWKGDETLWNFLFGKYLRTASRRGHQFHLNRAEFLSLTSMNCRYCGCAPFQVLKITAQSKRRNRSVKYMGIDRIDNKIGYTKENSVPCCKHCNVAKASRSESDFLKWAQQVAAVSLKSFPK